MHIRPIIESASTGLGRLLPLGLGLLLLVGCGKSPPTAATATPTVAPSAAAPTPATGLPPAAPATGLAGRTGELTNPDNPTMLYLYYDLAGITPPIDQWVEQDAHVRFAAGADKAAQRVAVKAAFQAGMAAVHGVGVIHLTSNASLSPYDPTYSEFTVGALSPGSVYTFKAQGQTVSLKFDNGLAAQSWSVPKDQAQAIVDKIGSNALTLDATVQIDKVLPQPDGGAIVARVVSWSLRNPGDGSTIARVQVADR